jgi:hypothetical protein
VILLAILTGVVAVYAWRRHIGWTELVILCGWGLLAAGTPLGHAPSAWLMDLNTYLSHWF